MDHGQSRSRVRSTKHPLTSDKTTLAPPPTEYEYIDEDETLTQEDAWVVISSFFDDKGLVTQQLESFNEFVENSMQELVDEEGNLTLDQYNQHTGLDRDETVSLVLIGRLVLGSANSDLDDESDRVQGGCRKDGRARMASDEIVWICDGALVVCPEILVKNSTLSRGRAGVRRT